MIDHPVPSVLYRVVHREDGSLRLEKRRVCPSCETSLVGVFWRDGWTWHTHPPLPDEQARSDQDREECPLAADGAPTARDR